MAILVTGAAGFIGYHVSELLLGQGKDVIGLDNLNDYYSVDLKKNRLARLQKHPKFTFYHAALEDEQALKSLFDRHDVTHVINLAAQAGVRYSLTNPAAYIQANLVGFGYLLECCRHHKVQHLVFASSSSVYGLNTKLPFSTADSTDHPVSLYAATKKANEMMAHSYSHLYGLPCTGLRFFTVYGPWGRPDMALFLFTKSILEGKAIDLFNKGDMQRDFTFIDDIVDGIVRCLRKTPTPNPAWDASKMDPAHSSAPYRLYNIGNNNTVQLKYFVEVLEKALGMRARVNLLPMQPGDVQATYADIDDISREVGFTPRTSIEEGIPRFVAWYKAYFKVN